MDEAQQEVAAKLAAQMFGEAIATGEVVVIDPEPEPVAAPAAPAAPQPVAAPAAPEPVVEAPAAPVEPPSYTFKPKLDDDLQALLDEPDFEAEAAAEVAEDDEYEYADPDTAAKIRAQEKRIAFLEGQVVAKSRKGWVEEAKRAFPDLARLIPGEIEAITATSRRAFLRAASDSNTKYATALGPTLARLEAERQAIASGAVEVARAEVQDAWGKPSGDTLPPVAVAQQEALEKARAANDLEGQVKALMQTVQVL